jgi:ankyrin repeat protein
MKTWWRNVGLIGFIVTYSFLSLATSELELWQACVDRDEEQVLGILRIEDSSVDPNYCHIDGTTPLWQAVDQGNAKLVSILLAKGASPDFLVVEQLQHGQKKRSKEGLNSLGQTEGVREDHKKRNWIKSKLKKTISAGKLSAKELAPLGKDIKGKTDAAAGVGLIALHLAVLRHQHHIIPILLNDDEGEQLLLCTQEGKNSFHMACRTGCLECLQALLQLLGSKNVYFCCLLSINSAKRELRQCMN